MNTKVLTINVPEPLLSNLETQAESEGVSLEHIVIHALSRQTKPAYKVFEASDRELRRQQRRHQALLQTLGQNGGAVSIEEAGRILKNREQVKPEKELDAEVFEKLQNVLKLK